MIHVRFRLIPVLICFIFSVIRIHGSSNSLKEESGIIDLFKAEKYKEIIELLYGKNGSGEWQKLLLAKSFERLGLYSRSNKILKEICNKNSRLHDLTAFFIANNYEKLNDFSSALRWYKNILLKPYNYPDTYGGSVDQAVIVSASFRRILQIALNEKGYFHSVERILKKASKYSLHANYFLALLYHKVGRLNQAADYYVHLLIDEKGIYHKKVMEQVVKDFTLIKIINEKGIDKTDLIHLCITNKLYNGALIISYLLPYSRYVGQLKAYCFFEIGDYQSAVVLYHEYYSHYNDLEALVKIAYSYFYLGEKKQSYAYLQKYLQKKGSLNSITADAFYLKLLLERNNNDIDLFIRESLYFIKKYYTYSKIDSFIQDTFYYIIQSNDKELAVSFVKNTYTFIRDSRYKAWAYFILGLYDNESFLIEAITHSPGSYYYYISAEKINITSNSIKTADRFYNKDKLNDALNIYIQLYSKGIQKNYTKSKIVQILSGKTPCKYFFEIEKIRSGKLESALFELYRLGLHTELIEIINTEFVENTFEEKIFYSYLLSKISYDSLDIPNGIRYAEKMANLTDKKYLVFLPIEILQLLYPYLYQDIIQSNLKNSQEYLDLCFILSIIREESRYNLRARSHRGALGLMQIMPDTASWIKNSNIKTNELLDPSSNIEIGILYLNYLVEKYDSEYLVLAAYNSGPTNVKRWLQTFSNENDLKFVEEIPFPETRNYVKKVISTYEMYRAIYGKNCY